MHGRFSHRACLFKSTITEVPDIVISPLFYVLTAIKIMQDCHELLTFYLGGRGSGGDFGRGRRGRKGGQREARGTDTLGSTPLFVCSFDRRRFKF